MEEPQPGEPQEWVKLKTQIRMLVKNPSRISVKALAMFGAGAAALIVAVIWAWLYMGLPNVPGAAGLWSLNREPGVTFVGPKGEIVGVRGAYHGRRVTLDDVPGYVPQAFLAIEDQRFYEHKGIDRLAVIRAALANLARLGTVQGGSTITQQLCKNLLLSPDRTIRRKLQEMILAGRVERALSKDEILELYLNRIYLGERAYGVDAAAHAYFNKPARELSLPEAAMLAGLPKAPSAYAPTRYFARAKERQRLVLQSMADTGAITREEADAAFAVPVKVVPSTLREGDLGYVFDMASDQARKLAGPKTPDLVVHITVDPALQQAATKAIRSVVADAAKGKRQMQAALVSVDNDGAVRALIGGHSYSESKFNRAIQARRQPGSAFKTFVYAAAFEAGYDTDTVRYDEPVTINGWQPKNYYSEYRGAVSLRTAFALSLNTVAAVVGHEVGEAKVAALARRMGINSPLEAVPSLSLGSSAVTLMEMTQAYSTFMREGKRVDAYLVQGVENARGDVLYERPAYTPKPVYDAALAQRMTGMMGRVVQAGTGTGARLGDRQAAGKTGTSSDWRDAWFVGYTADYTTGVWVGYDDYSPMAHVSGGTMPSAIWRTYMTAASRGLPERELPGYYLPGHDERDFRLATFYDALKAAFGFGDDDENVSQ
ncbi:MAG: transglycosylase domain-containing protein [Hyphomonadaceae bacterium]